MWTWDTNHQYRANIVDTLNTKKNCINICLVQIYNMYHIYVLCVIPIEHNITYILQCIEFALHMIEVLPRAVCGWLQNPAPVWQMVYPTVTDCNPFICRVS
jgi:hypothetical protein